MSMHFGRRSLGCLVGVLGITLAGANGCANPAFDFLPDLKPGGAGGDTAQIGAGAPSAGGDASSGAGKADGGLAEVAGDPGYAGSSFGGAVGGSSSGGAMSGGAPSGGGGVAGALNTGGRSGAGGAVGSAGTAGAGCAPGVSELCEGFESGKIDSAKWTTPQPSSGATVKVDTSRSHSGKYSLHIQASDGAQNYGVIAENVTFPAQKNTFYTRVFAYFSPDIPVGVDKNYQVSFMYADGKNDAGNVQTGVGIRGGAAQFLGYSIFFGDPFFQFGPSSATRVTPGHWLCIELLEDGSKTETEVRQVWLNDVELGELHTDSAMAAGDSNPNHRSPAFNQLTIGLSEFFSTPTLTDMWIDDIRVSSAKIGCTL